MAVKAALRMFGSSATDRGSKSKRAGAVPVLRHAVGVDQPLDNGLMPRVAIVARSVFQNRRRAAVISTAPRSRSPAVPICTRTTRRFPGQLGA
jgi:hypothetical protein